MFDKHRKNKTKSEIWLELLHRQYNKHLVNIEKAASNHTTPETMRAPTTYQKTKIHHISLLFNFAVE
ncbi:Uncharacterized protein TCM_028299 [Theobroma cacao]|uniref:Uncharacterized protein n=1 Tax=Theobroma cacao TaxID=3641 RepID=A0A061GAB5_THECC|nr:Uncharacterized protein TCM_028299 [Theobroma cacao]